MNVSLKPSHAATQTRNTYAVAGILLLILLSFAAAYRFPKAYVTFGDLLPNLVEGVTPLAVAIVTVAIGAIFAAAVTKVVFSLLQYLIAFSVETHEDANRDLNNNPAPFFMVLQKSDKPGSNQFYYTWKWEHALFLATILQFLFLAGMGHLARFA